MTVISSCISGKIKEKNNNLGKVAIHDNYTFIVTIEVMVE